MAFERLQENDLVKLEAMFKSLGGFRVLQLIKDTGYIGREGKLTKINYVTVQDGKIIFEQITE